MSQTTTVVQVTNDNLILISGESGCGKSLSLMNLENPEGVLYLNCEAGKKLPFRNKFKNTVITDPLQVLKAFDFCEANPGKYHTIVIDTLTFLMDMYESIYIVGSANTMAGWGNYNQFFKTLMQDKVAKAKVNVIILAHTLKEFNEERGIYESKVPVKGALKNQGIEAYFSTVVSAKKVPMRVLEKYENDMLKITEEEAAVGFKHVFQTRITKDSVGERIRAPFGMFAEQETYTNNDVQMLLKHTHSYFNAP